MIALQILAVAAGLLVVAWVLWSAIRTVVVPRGESVWLSRKVFLVMREVFELAARRTPHLRELRPDHGPLRARSALLVLPLTWALAVFVAFIPIYWGLGRRAGARRSSPAGRRSRRSASTVPTPLGRRACSASSRRSIGLGLVALLISYLPAIYSSFARREAEVVKLEVRAGSPPSAVEFLIRIHRIRGLDYFASSWDEWEQWFVELEESHTSHPALAFFRSPAAQQLVDHRRRRGAGHRRAHRVVPRHRAQPAGPGHDPVRASWRCGGIADLLPPAVRPRPGPRRADLDPPRGVRRAHGRARARPGCPSRPTSTRRGATTPAGGSTTTSRCWGCARWRRPRLRRGRRTGSST